MAVLVLSWAVPKHYGPRITEHSQSPPSSYRLAVTESGINTGGVPPVTPGETSVGTEKTNRAIGLVWIGEPVGTHAGLLVLLGTRTMMRKRLGAIVPTGHLR